MPKLIMSSDEYGSEEFEYGTMKELLEGKERLISEIDKLDDGIERKFQIVGDYESIPFDHEELITLLEIARIALCDAQTFDEMAEELDLSDEAMSDLSDRLNAFMQKDSAHEHTPECRYIGNDMWDCGKIDNVLMESVNHCDGNHEVNGVVKLLPTGGGANMIVCRSCYEKEIKYRKQRISEGVHFELPSWVSLEVYDGGR